MYLATKSDNDKPFDKNIPDADRKKIIQHHFKLKKKHAWRLHELCVENVSKKETFNVMINVRPCTITRQGHFVSCQSCRICLWEEKLSLC